MSFARNSLLFAFIISTSNTANEKPIYYLKNQTGGAVPEGAGQVILANCSNVEIANQNLSNCSIGIELGFSDYNNITNISAGGNYNGIYLLYSCNNNIRNSNISNNRYAGIRVDSSSDGNQIFENNIAGNYHGIRIDSSTDNMVYHNNFLYNLNNADVSSNQWDNGYPSGGNYWTDYSGGDVKSGPAQNKDGSDGIGDTPYENIIYGSNKDNYPLMIPYGNYLSLHSGWNLISVPSIQSDTDMGAVLSSITGSYDTVQRYNKTDINDHWKSNHSSKPSKMIDLNGVDHTMGFWIFITEPGGVLFEYFGTIPSVSQQIPLHPGWNLVGYPSLTSHSRSDGLNNTDYGTRVRIIWWYDNATGSWYSMGEDDYFRKGVGYWIYAEESMIWQVPL
ncbi:MAG: right-handed parallel beta-helix repeat-containing protein [Thermoplasmata archaeon]|nr:MAG: right-handed parallel beta-helix repeat-containing protein [Thermoplasmata archaeon]